MEKFIDLEKKIIDIFMTHPKVSMFKDIIPVMFECVRGKISSEENISKIQDVIKSALNVVYSTAGKTFFVYPKLMSGENDNTILSITDFIYEEYQPNAYKIEININNIDDVDEEGSVSYA